MATIVPMFGGEDRLTVKATGQAFTAGLLVKLTGFANDELSAAKAVATGGVDGIMNVDVAQNEKGAMIALVPGTIMKVQAETGVAAGDALKCSANGKVTTATVGTDADFLIIGRALTATSGGFVYALVK